MDRAQAGRAPREPPPPQLRRVLHRAQGARHGLYRQRRAAVGRRRRRLFAARLLARLQQHLERGRGPGLGLDGRRLDRGVGLRGPPRAAQVMTVTLADARVAAGMRAQLELRRRAIAAGARRIGWKVGFGAPAALAKFALTAPLIGFMLDRNVLAAGATVSLAGWVKPAAEPEVAVEIAADLAGGGSRAAAAEAIGAIGPAIELADVAFAPEDVETILAGNMFHRHVLLGPRDHGRRGGRTDGLHARIARNGAAHADTTEIEANTGKLVDIVRNVADVLAQCGEQLKTGDVIIAGSVIAPMFLGSEDRALDYALDPIGSVAVRFAA